MNQEKIKGIIEAILFSAGRPVKIEEFILNLEINKEEIEKIIKECRKIMKRRKRNRTNKNRRVISIVYQKRIL